VTNSPSTFSLILASTSPRRRELLAQAGFEFEAISPGESGVDEIPQSNESPQDYVTRLAQAKSLAGLNSLMPLRSLNHVLVLGADTTVTIDGHILEKPVDTDDAQRMLKLLSGRTHQVLTALTLRNLHREESILSISEVQFKVLSQQEIDAYITSGEPFDKAGGYGIQGRAALFIKHLEGSYSGVMGLPLFELGILLQRFESNTHRIE
jgi:septum formation protein